MGKECENLRMGVIRHKSKTPPPPNAPTQYQDAFHSWRGCVCGHSIVADFWKRKNNRYADLLRSCASVEFRYDDGRGQEVVLRSNPSSYH